MDTLLDAKMDRFNERKIIDKICSSIYHMVTIVTIVMRKGQIFKRSLASV